MQSVVFQWTSGSPWRSGGSSTCCRHIDSVFRRDLYLTYALMVLESFNYFSTSLLFVLYLTQEFKVGDVEVCPLLSANYGYRKHGSHCDGLESFLKSLCCYYRQGLSMACGELFWWLLEYYSPLSSI